MFNLFSISLHPAHSSEEGSYFSPLSAGERGSGVRGTPGFPLYQRKLYIR